MAGTLRGDSGGILGLLQLLDEHGEAIDYDCLTLGLDLNDLGSQRFGWRRLKAVVTHLPATSALAQDMHGAAASWSTSDYLLAASVDALNAANWQRGGGKGRKPKPVPRPGEQSKSERRFGTGAMTVEQAREFFDRVNRTTRPVVLEGGCSEAECVSPVKARGMCSKHYQRWWRSSRA